MRELSRFRLFFAISILTGCAGLIGVPDLTFDENAPQGNPDSAAGGDTSTNNPDGSETGPADTGPPCDTTKLQTDPSHCGRCGHDCVGGACKAGKCEAVQIGNIGGAPLNHIVEYGPSVFVSTLTQFTTELGGIWKAAKTTGNPVPFVTGDTFRNAEQMAVVGDTLYFVVNEASGAADSGDNGGFYSCDLKGPTPCVPKLIAYAENPAGVALDKGKVFYSDRTTGTGIMSLTPPSAAPPAVFRLDWAPYQIWVDGDAVFFISSLGISANEERGVLFDLIPDASDATELSRYQKPNAAAGSLVGDSNSVYFSALDFTVTTGGVVRRISRPGKPQLAPCDFAANKNKRPDALYLDATHIYWLNRGDPATPFAGGSLARCEISGCCADPEVLWTGDGEPVAITADATAFYFVTRQTAQIWKLAKP